MLLAARLGIDRVAAVVTRFTVNEATCPLHPARIIARSDAELPD